MDTTGSGVHVAGDGAYDIIVIIPGILGTRLARSGEIVWGVGHAAANVWRLTRKLTGDLAFIEDAYDAERMTSGVNDGVTTDGLLATRAILPGVWRTDGYDLIR